MLSLSPIPKTISRFVCSLISILVLCIHTACVSFSDYQLCCLILLVLSNLLGPLCGFCSSFCIWQFHLPVPQWRLIPDSLNSVMCICILAFSLCLQLLTAFTSPSGLKQKTDQKSLWGSIFKTIHCWSKKLHFEGVCVFFFCLYLYIWCYIWSPFNKDL